MKKFLFFNLVCLSLLVLSQLPAVPPPPLRYNSITTNANVPIVIQSGSTGITILGNLTATNVYIENDSTQTYSFFSPGLLQYRDFASLLNGIEIGGLSNSCPFIRATVGTNEYFWLNNGQVMFDARYLTNFYGGIGFNGIVTNLGIGQTNYVHYTNGIALTNIANEF